MFAEDAAIVANKAFYRMPVARIWLKVLCTWPDISQSYEQHWMEGNGNVLLAEAPFKSKGGPRKDAEDHICWECDFEDSIRVANGLSRTLQQNG